MKTRVSGFLFHTQHSVFNIRCSKRYKRLSDSFIPGFLICNFIRAYQQAGLALLRILKINIREDMFC